MAIIRFDPFSGRRWMSPFFSYNEEENWPEIKMTEGIDVFEENNQVVVKAAVPGGTADQADVTFEDGVLRITAKVTDSEEEKKRKKVIDRMDRVASFDYTATLPRAIDVKSLEAKVENGVVVVTAKIAEEAKPKKITVKTG